MAQACKVEIPHETFGCALTIPGVAEQPFLFIASEEFPAEQILRVFPEILLAVERDLGGLVSAIAEPHAFDGYLKYDRKRIENTSLVQDYWRPFRVEEQVLAPLWHGGIPVGYLHLVRSRKEGAFTPEDLRRFEDARVVAERAVFGLAALGRAELTATLDAVSRGFPYPAFLFDAAGTLAWASHEARVRLEVEAFRSGASAMGTSGSLEVIRRAARARLANRTFDLEGALRRHGLLGAGERAALREFAELGERRLLVALVPALAFVPGEASSTSVPGLGAVEAKVARMASEGFSVLNIATQLAVSESTVRTHLRRVYTKLGVHGRAELATALMRP
ncbi:MAG: LuxR C-terminal-related transcriptional regulator [Anaeromyxobacter sp.]